MYSASSGPSSGRSVTCRPGRAGPLPYLARSVCGLRQRWWKKGGYKYAGAELHHVIGGWCSSSDPPSSAPTPDHLGDVDVARARERPHPRDCALAADLQRHERPRAVLRDELLQQQWQQGGQWGWRSRAAQEEEGPFLRSRAALARAARRGTPRGTPRPALQPQQQFGMHARLAQEGARAHLYSREVVRAEGCDGEWTCAHAATTRSAAAGCRGCEAAQVGEYCACVPCSMGVGRGRGRSCLLPDRAPHLTRGRRTSRHRRGQDEDTRALAEGR